MKRLHPPLRRTRHTDRSRWRSVLTVTCPCCTTDSRVRLPAHAEAPAQHRCPRCGYLMDLRPAGSGQASS